MERWQYSSGKPPEVEAAHGEFKFPDEGGPAMGYGVLDETGILKVFADGLEKLLLPQTGGFFGHICIYNSVNQAQYR